MARATCSNCSSVFTWDDSGLFSTPATAGILGGWLCPDCQRQRLHDEKEVKRRKQEQRERDFEKHIEEIKEIKRQSNERDDSVAEDRRRAEAESNRQRVAEQERERTTECQQGYQQSVSSWRDEDPEFVHYCSLLDSATRLMERGNLQLAASDLNSAESQHYVSDASRDLRKKLDFWIDKERASNRKALDQRNAALAEARRVQEAEKVERDKRRAALEVADRIEDDYLKSVWRYPSEGEQTRRAIQCAELLSTKGLRPQSLHLLAMVLSSSRVASVFNQELIRAAIARIGAG